MKVWLVGAKGMLGQAVSKSLDTAAIAHVDTDAETDFVDPAVVDAFVQREHPDWIVNCAAYTAVDQAEDEEAKALKLNADGPANLSAAAAKSGASLIHISTDYVFSGDLDRPYREDDTPNPESAYGRTKLAGEVAVRERLDYHVIVRTAWLYGHCGKNFVETMLRLMAEREELSIVDDQIGSPTNATDLANAIATIVGHRQPTYGTFHYSGTGECSWYGFASEIYRQARELGLIGSECSLRPVTSDQFPQKAKRPSNSRLSKEKIGAAYRIVPPAWEESLHRYLAERKTHE